MSTRRPSTSSLHVCQSIGLVEAPRYQAGRGLLLRILAMLVQMARRAEEPGTGTGSGTGTGTK